MMEIHGSPVTLSPYELIKDKNIIGSLFGGIKPKSYMYIKLMTIHALPLILNSKLNINSELRMVPCLKKC